MTTSSLLFARSYLAQVTALLALAMLSACASLMAPTTTRLANNLSAAVLNQNDPETVRQGAPAYLLLVDSLIEGDPENSAMLQTGARLYVAYAVAFVEDPQRARRLTRRAVDYADRALCRDFAPACSPAARSLDGFVAALGRATPQDVPVLYTWGVAQAGWIQANSDNWNAIAELPKVEAVMQRVVDSTRHTSAVRHTYIWAFWPRSARPHWVVARKRAVGISSARWRFRRART